MESYHPDILSECYMCHVDDKNFIKNPGNYPMSKTREYNRVCGLSPEYLRRMCPDGLPYINSRNHDSCSISSARMSLAISYVAGSLPIVMLQILFQLTGAPYSALRYFFNITI